MASAIRTNLLDKRRFLSDECLSGGDKHDK